MVSSIAIFICPPKVLLVLLLCQIVSSVNSRNNNSGRHSFRQWKPTSIIHNNPKLSHYEKSTFPHHRGGGDGDGDGDGDGGNDGEIIKDEIDNDMHIVEEVLDGHEEMSMSINGHPPDAHHAHHAPDEHDNITRNRKNNHSHHHAHKSDQQQQKQQQYLQQQQHSLPFHHPHSSFYSPFHQSLHMNTHSNDYFPSHRRNLYRTEEKAILGRAVLTTPHRRMPAIRIAPGPKPPFMSPQNPGPIYSSTPIYVTKSTICKSLNCALRDLRIIDQYNGGGGSASGASSSSRYHVSGPAFLARRNCIIVNVGHVRAIVMRDQVIVFLPWDNQSNGNNSDRNDGNNSSSSSSSSSNGSGSGSSNSLDSHEGGGAGDSSEKHSKTSDVTRRIQNLVEALVMHLNSIYQTGHHLIMEEVSSLSSSSSSTKATSNDFDNVLDIGADTYLTSEYDTNMGQQWGSGWYQEQQYQSESDTATSKKRTKKNHDDKNQTKRNLFQRKQKGNHKTQKENEMNHQLPKTQAAKAPPFELVVIEALLGHVCSNESSKVSHLIQNAQDVLSGITYTKNSSNHRQNKKKDAFLEMQRKLGELLPLKNKVDELEAKCTEVASAIAEVLKNDEDMAAMRLSEIATLKELNEDFVTSSMDEGDPYNLHVEVVLLFEDYLLQMDEVLHSLRSIQSSITNTEEVVEIELDLLRNRIMRYEMLLELSGLVVGVAAAVTGAFGMNLVNHFEDHPRMFYEVSLGLIVFMVGMGYALLKKLSMDSIL